MGYSNTSANTYEGKRFNGRHYSENKYRGGRRNPMQERSPKHQRYARRGYEECPQEQDYHCHQEYRQYTRERACEEYVEYNEQYNDDQYYAEPQCEEYYYCPNSDQECCPDCYFVQKKRESHECHQSKNQRTLRRDGSKYQERKPGQAPPRRIDTLVPKTFTHNPYSLSTSEAPTHREYFAHDDCAQNIPKDCVLCLRWVNGSCGEKRKRGNDVEQSDVCPYAHPDLSEVPTGVCPTYWFTGFCRFDRRDATQAGPEDASHEFGYHGWSHYKRLDNTASGPQASTSDDSSNDGEKKKSDRRRRPQSVCFSCHHAQPKGGFYLLPGISCKTTVLEREAALGLYPKWY